MSQVQIENKENLDQQLQEENSSVYTSEVSITTESEEVPVQKLSEMQNKNKFLTKVGLYFLIHSFFALGVILFIKFSQRESKKVYRTLRLEKTLGIYVTISIALKIVWGFLARFIKFLNLFIFLIDSILLSFITLGMFYYLEEYKRIYYINNSFFMAIYAVGFSLMSFAFIASTFFKNKKTSYNTWVGIILMLVASLITLKLVDEFWLKKPMQIYHFLIALLFMILWTFYVPLNAFLIVNFRGDRLQSNDAIVSYFEYGTDWFSFFWAQIFLNIKFVKRRLKKRNRNKRRKQKAQKKKVKENPVIENDIEQGQQEVIETQQQQQDIDKVMKSVPDIDDDFLFEQNSKKKISKVQEKEVDQQDNQQLTQQQRKQQLDQQRDDIEYSGTNPTNNI